MIICTQEDPWDPSKGEYGVFHPDAEQMFPPVGFTVAVYKCQHCRTQFNNDEHPHQKEPP